MKVKLYLLQRGSLLFFFVLLFHSLLFSQQVAKTIPNSSSPEGLIGFLEFRPSDYGSQKHPLIIFLHGIGERGNGTSQINSITANAIPKYCAAGATMRFTVGGQTSSFVVLSPQLSSLYGYWPTYYVTEMIKYAKANLSIDPNRIYITGLSLGGGGTWRAITEANTQNFDFSFDAGIAAAAPVCGTQEENDGYFCKTIGDNHLPVWAFHSMDDGTVGVGATQHAELLANGCGVTPAAKFTYYQSGNHYGAWDRAYDTGHITSIVNGGGSFTANPNLYEWFLSHTRSSAPVYTAPVANAGVAQTITLPLSTITLTGSGSGTNGATISSYSWAKTSGPSAGVLSLPLLNTSVVTGLVQGTYVFTLTVTDNHGLTSSSSVTITVNPLFNQSPTANAGSNTSLTLPTSNTTLNGSASSDPDGSISTYAWTKTSGPSSYTIANANAATTALTNLVQGVYVFTLKVTDNGGATATSTVTVTVNAAANQLPVANAGSNTSLTLPANNTTLNGSASNDPDGSISTYTWSKTSGPGSYNITNPGAVTTAVTNLVQGVYVFTLQVTDNAGATASSAVTITVNSAANQLPVANAGSNTSLTLPANNTTLNGSASNDPDGSISTYTWTKTSGPSSYNITNPGAASTLLNNLVQGVYVFTLQVTDNAGATASSNVTITVNSAANQAPVAKAGTDIIIVLPTSSTTLNGSGSNDPDGTISTYAWTKTSGPASYNMANAGAAITALSNLVQGVYVFTLQVTDNGGATASSVVTVTVNAAPLPSNQSPIANAGSNISITLPVNNTILDGTASNDPDGTISTYVWTKTSGPSTYNITNPGAITSVLNNLVQGTYVFALQVTDDAGAAASSTVTITVNAAPNQLPTANAGSNATITLPVNNVTVDGSASGDPDGTISTYAWTKTSGPSSYTIANAGSAATAVTSLVQGVYVFTLKVTDNAGGTAVSTVTITVNAAPNQAPTANAGSNITLTLPTGTTNLDGSGSNDPDGSISTYAWTKTSGPSSYNITNPGAATTVLSNLVQGVYVFTLQVTDNAGATASSTVNVTVNAAPVPANQSPVANAGSNITITLPTSNATLDGSASNDPDGGISSYVWTETSGPASYNITNPGAATTVLNNLVQGVYVFTLQVTDNAGATALSAVTVTVNAAIPPPPPANKVPVANAGSNTSITLPVNYITLDGSASGDSDGTISTYGWTKSSGPASYSIVNPTAATTSLNNLTEGVYIFTLQVADNAGATASSTVTVTVNAAVAPPPPVNLAPVVNAGGSTSITLPVNSTTLDGSASIDPDGTISTYAWSKTSGPDAYTIANAGAATTALGNLVQGVYVFTLQVTDSKGASASSTVTVTVNKAANQAPVANAGADVSIALPVNTTLLDGSGSSDPDGTIATYSWNKISGPGAITIVNSNTAAPAVIGLAEGQYVFELTITDNDGATATDQVAVTVRPQPNKAPVADAGKDTSVALPVSSVVLSGSNSADADGSISAYSWKEISGPSAAIVAQANGITTQVNGLVEGDYIFELKVTDNAGDTATAKIKISVLNNFRYTQFFKVYPNPATSSINLQFIDDKTGKLAVAAYDVNGRLVMNEEISKDRSLITKEINISKLKPGMYYLEIRQADGTKLIRPFVKQ